MKQCENCGKDTELYSGLCWNCFVNKTYKKHQLKKNISRKIRG